MNNIKKNYLIKPDKLFLILIIFLILFLKGLSASVNRIKLRRENNKLSIYANKFFSYYSKISNNNKNILIVSLSDKLTDKTLVNYIEKLFYYTLFSEKIKFKGMIYLGDPFLRNNLSSIFFNIRDENGVLISEALDKEIREKYSNKEYMEFSKQAINKYIKNYKIGFIFYFTFITIPDGGLSMEIRLLEKNNEYKYLSKFFKTIWLDKERLDMPEKYIHTDPFEIIAKYTEEIKNTGYINEVLLDEISREYYMIIKSLISEEDLFFLKGLSYIDTLNKDLDYLIYWDYTNDYNLQAKLREFRIIDHKFALFSAIFRGSNISKYIEPIKKLKWVLKTPYNEYQMGVNKYSKYIERYLKVNHNDIILLDNSTIKFYLLFEGNFLKKDIIQICGSENNKDIFSFLLYKNMTINKIYDYVNNKK